MNNHCEYINIWNEETELRVESLGSDGHASSSWLYSSDRLKVTSSVCCVSLRTKRVQRESANKTWKMKGKNEKMKPSHLGLFQWISSATAVNFVHMLFVVIYLFLSRLLKVCLRGHFPLLPSAEPAMDLGFFYESPWSRNNRKKSIIAGVCRFLCKLHQRINQCPATVISNEVIYTSSFFYDLFCRLSCSLVTC